MAEEKKGATIFDFIGGVTDKKREWKKWSETDQKKFSPFIVNRWLSMRMELTELVNDKKHIVCTMNYCQPIKVLQNISKESLKINSIKI